MKVILKWNKKQIEFFYQKLKNQEALPLKGNIFVGYRLNRAGALELSAGAPLTIRTNRPDGFTRSFVASIKIYHLYRFSKHFCPASGK